MESFSPVIMIMRRSNQVPRLPKVRFRTRSSLPSSMLAAACRVVSYQKYW